jgi:DNA polymerase III alpha subunit (gram-positive type)
MRNKQFRQREIIQIQQEMMRDNHRRQLESIRNNQRNPGSSLDIIRANQMRQRNMADDNDTTTRLANIIRANQIRQNSNNNNIRNVHNNRQTDEAIVNNFMNNILSQILTEERQNLNRNNNRNNQRHNNNNEINENSGNNGKKLEEILEEIELNEELIKKLDSNVCNICLDNYTIGDKICYLPCVHFFHAICIKSWVKRSNKCPLCKNVIKFE